MRGVARGVGNARGPSTPWFASDAYLADDTAPIMVADFANDRYMAGGNQITFAQLFDFTSAGGGSFTDKNGDPQTAAVNQPRIDYTNGYGELLIDNTYTENCQSIGTKFTGWYDNTGPNTFLIDFAAPDGQLPIHVDNGWLFEKFYVGYTSTNIAGQVRTNNPARTLSFSIASGGSVGDPAKAAIVMADLDWKSCANGTLGAGNTDRNIPVGINRMRMGQNYNGSIYTGVRIKEVRCYDFRVTNSELQRITAL